MRFSVAACVLLVAGADAFAPARFATRVQTARSLAFDPSIVQDLPNHVHSLQSAFSSISLSDAADAVAAVADTTNAAAEVAASDNGWFGFLTGPTEGLLQLIHSTLVGVGLSQDAWGASIIALTLLIKLLTFPLTKTQLESTNKMQALQPLVKDIQAKYQSNPEVMNQKIAEVYQTNQVNPLAGCVPSLVQIPVFIGLYRAVLDLAKDNALNEPFLFLPNLEGPTYSADPASGASWLFEWVNGVPPLGWEDTIAFLILPVFLVISQFISMELMQPKGQQPQEGNAILKFLPLLIGWFSLNVPAALCLYWVTNNLVTTATSVFIRSTMPSEPATATEGGATAVAPTPQEIFAPPPLRERPAGFSAPEPVADADGVKPLTSIDAEIVEKVTGSPPSEGGEKKSGKKKRNKKKKRN